MVATAKNTFYIDENGSLWGCGNNANGELGVGDQNFRTQFVKIVNGNVASVSTREYNTFFIKEDGSLWGMGSNSDGQLGTGSFGGSSRAFPMKIVDHGVIDIANGSYHTLFVKSDGSLWGMEKIIWVNLASEITTASHPRFNYGCQCICCGNWKSWFTCTQRRNTLVLGDNYQGRLGDGSDTKRNLPVRVVDQNVTSSVIMLISIFKN